MTDVTGQGRERAPEAALVLIDDGDRQWDSTPADVGIGVVRLSGWQVHQIWAPDSFAGQDSYLIRLNYELALEPEVPAPPWFEVGFGFSDSSTKEPVAVLDALPRTVFQSCKPSSYRVSSYLNFCPVRGAATAEAALPALSPFIDVFGVGRPEPIRWRYLAAGPGGGKRSVRPGSYVSWIIAIVRGGCAGLDVRLTVRYDMDPDDALGCLPDTRPTEFRLALTQRAAGIRPIAPAVEGQERDPDSAEAVQRPARIFVSYAHDDDQHVESVRAFAEFLAQRGFDVHLDRWDTDRRRDWYQWATEQVRQADFVIVVASPACRQVGDGEIENIRHRGLQSEMGLLRELLHADRSLWITKLLPVVLPGGSVSDIPLFLQPQTADHFLIEGLTISGSRDLIRVITRQPSYRRPATAAPQ